MPLDLTLISILYLFCLSLCSYSHQNTWAWCSVIWACSFLLGCSFLPLCDPLLSLLGPLHPLSLQQIPCPQGLVLGSLSVMFQDSPKLYFQDINLVIGPMLLLHQILHKSSNIALQGVVT